MQVHDTTSAPLNQMDQRPLGLRAERRAQELEVWDQNRRTKEELMEMGTIVHALLQGDSLGVHRTVSTAAEPSEVGA